VDIQAAIQAVLPYNVILDILPSLPEIDADKQRIKKIIEDLIDEMADLPVSPADGQIVISVEAETTELIIRLLVIFDSNVRFI
jgi:hypothetical protein